MSSKKAFTRNEISKQAEKVEEKNTSNFTMGTPNFINEWCEFNGWKYEELIEFLNSIGVKPQLNFNEFKQEEQIICFGTNGEFKQKALSIKTITTEDDEVTIILMKGDWVNFPSTISLCEKGKLERNEEYIINRKEKNSNEKPKVIRKGVNYRKEQEKVLVSYYYFHSCDRILKIDSKHKLIVRLNDPKTNTEKDEVLVLRNYEAIEKYLLKLDNSLIVSEVYETIIKLLEFTEDDIRNSPHISVSYFEEMGEESNKHMEARSRIYISKGKITKYGVLENGETFEVSKTGNWRYLSEKISIECIKENKKFVISMTGKEEYINNHNLKELINRVKRRIEDLRKVLD